MREAPRHRPGAPETRLLNRATAAAAVLAASIFAADVATPAGPGIGVLYVVPLLVARLSGPPRFQLVAAAVASALTLAGYWLAPLGVSGPCALSTRAMAVVVIWTTAIVLGRFPRTWLELRARTVDLQARSKDLADVNFPLDQAAIVAITNTKGTITYVNQKF